jgi:hypothetical protein
MPNLATAPSLDRYTLMGDLTENVKTMIRRLFFRFTVLLGLAVAYLFFSGNPGALAFAYIAAGSAIALRVWAGLAIGVPLLPMLVIQQLVINGLPILSNHDILRQYPAEFIASAGLQVLVFALALIGGWRLALQMIQPADGRAYVLVGIDRDGVAGLSRLGFGLVGGATLFLVLQSLDLSNFIFELLPSGSYPIVGAVTAAASASGFFLLSMILGSGDMAPVSRTFFWAIMALNCMISASSLLLSSAAVVIASVIIGLFWSRGQLPWRFIVVVMCMLSFFNSGKYEMRGRYWQSPDEEAPPASGLTQLPAFYAEWTQAGFKSLTGGGDDEDPATLAARQGRGAKGEQSLFDRLNNLQNLLFVIDATEVGKVPPIDGKTYAIIPPLLVPRILWPSKPRTHEGQIQLNVHFGRQDLQSTITTYIAWGMLAEAYGNFGAIKGALLVGLAMGIFFAWGEAYTARKPLMSTEGLVAFAIFLGLANSYEAVASVAVTAIFQSLIPIIAACAPFVQRKTLVRPAEA